MNENRFDACGGQLQTPVITKQTFPIIFAEQSSPSDKNAGNGEDDAHCRNNDGSIK